MPYKKFMRTLPTPSTPTTSTVYRQLVLRNEMVLKIKPAAAEHLHQLQGKCSSCLCLIEDWWLTAEQWPTAYTSDGSAYTSLTGKLKWSQLCAWWVPKLWCSDQLQTRAELSTEILNKWNQDWEAFMQRTVTPDETQPYHTIWSWRQSTPEAMLTRCKCGRGPVKGKADWSRAKVMATVSGMLRTFWLLTFSMAKQW